MEKRKITIWSKEEAEKFHVNSPELLGLLKDYLPKEDIVYDFGCGDGYILAGLSEAGFTCKGIEGTPGIIEIAKFKDIIEADLSKPVDDLLFEKKGSVLSFEVAEHLLPEQEEQFLKTITSAVNYNLIISWAVEGQQGYGHNNCRNADYVIPKIESMGFRYVEEDSLTFRKIAGSGEASWFLNTIYIFRKNG